MNAEYLIKLYQLAKGKRLDRLAYVARAWAKEYPGELMKAYKLIDKLTQPYMELNYAA